jgi:hypothetical protein
MGFLSILPNYDLQLFQNATTAAIGTALVIVTSLAALV